ncbi:hypothetical protein ACFQX7_12065 [Luedemannella flava]
MAGRRTGRAFAIGVGATCVLLGILIIAPRGLTVPLADEAYALADRYAGVLALLALTGAVVAGLVAALHGPLGPTQRLRMQTVHRAASTAAVGALALHIVIKVVADEVSPGQAVVPTHALTWQSGHVVAVGLGSLSAYLLLFIVVTGVARGWFAGTGRPVRWRVLHSMAYACWFFSAWHGLTAGRHPATWVTVSYLVCGFLCAATVVVRLVERQRRRTRALTSTGTGALLKASVPAAPTRSGGGAHAAGVRPVSAPAYAGSPTNGGGLPAYAGSPTNGAGLPTHAGGPTNGTGLRPVSAPVGGLVGGAQAARADLARAARSGEWARVPTGNHQPVSGPAFQGRPRRPRRHDPCRRRAPCRRPACVPCRGSRPSRPARVPARRGRRPPQRRCRAPRCRGRAGAVGAATSRASPTRRSGRS